MSDVSNDTMTATAPRHTRRLSDKILIAFHQACDWEDFEVAERLLKVVETVLAVPRPIDRERREQEALVAAHERLWQLRHPDAGEEGMTVRPSYGRPHARPSGPMPSSAQQRAASRPIASGNIRKPHDPHRHHGPPFQAPAEEAESGRDIEAHRFPEQSANTTYWLSTNIELKKAPITLHVEGCSILRRSRWRKLRVLTGPLTSAQIAVLPDHGYQTCGRCKPTAPA